MRRSFLLSIISILFSQLSHCQKDNIRFKRLVIENGLLQISGKCILQDEMGFMWFGKHAGGINKFDNVQIIIPSIEALEKLYNYALRYEYQFLGEQLNYIDNQDNRMVPFVSIIQQLAEDFRVNEIIVLLQNA